MSHVDLGDGVRLAMITVFMLAIVGAAGLVYWHTGQKNELWRKQEDARILTAGRCLELCRPEAVKTILEDECVCAKLRVRLKGDK